MSDYNREKEFIRQHFMDGTLDVGSSFETMKAFCEIMAGEMEAVVAIQQCMWLSDDQRRELIPVARPTPETLREYKAWSDSVVNGRRPRKRRAA